MKFGKIAIIFLVIMQICFVSCTTVAENNRRINESGLFIGELDLNGSYINNYFGFSYNLSKAKIANFRLNESNHPTFDQHTDDDYLYFEFSSFVPDSDDLVSPSFSLSIFPVEENVKTKEEAIINIYSDFQESDDLHYTKVNIISEIPNLSNFDEYLIKASDVESYDLIFKQENYFFMISMYFDGNDYSYEVLKDFISTFTFYSSEEDWNKNENKLTLTGNYYNDYMLLLENNQLDDLYSLLIDWEKEDFDNPELYIAYYNYYIRKGSHSKVSLSSKPNNSDQLEIKDQNTGEIVGYLYDDINYDLDDIQKSFQYINMGLKLSPNRLDMHFGKIHLLGEIGDFKSQVSAIKSVLELSILNGNNWYWIKSEKITDGKDFLINNLQDYVSQWINYGTNETLNAMKDFSEHEILFYPNETYGYNNLAYYYILNKNIDSALDWFLKAETVNNNDPIVLLNIAKCYADKKMNDEAKIYLKKVIQINDSRYSEYAKIELEKL
jgi:hypothetical protein